MAQLLALQEEVVEQARGAEAEPVGVEPVLAGDLVDHDEVLDGVLGGPDAAGRLDADLLAGGSRQSRTASSMIRVTGSVAAGWTLPVEVLMKSPPAEHRQPRGAADVVVGDELAGLHDDLEVGACRAGGLHLGDLVEDGEVVARRGTRRGR